MSYIIQVGNEERDRSLSLNGEQAKPGGARGGDGNAVAPPLKPQPYSPQRLPQPSAPFNQPPGTTEAGERDAKSTGILGSNGTSTTAGADSAGEFGLALASASGASGGGDGGHAHGNGAHLLLPLPLPHVGPAPTALGFGGGGGGGGGEASLAEPPFHGHGVGQGATARSGSREDAGRRPAGRSDDGGKGAFGPARSSGQRQRPGEVANGDNQGVAVPSSLWGSRAADRASGSGLRGEEEEDREVTVGGRVGEGREGEGRNGVEASAAALAGPPPLQWGAPQVGERCRCESQLLFFCGYAL